MILTREIYHAVHTFAISIFKFIHFFVTFHGNQMAVLNTIHKPQVLIPLYRERYFKREMRCFCAQKSTGMSQTAGFAFAKCQRRKRVSQCLIFNFARSEDLGQEGLQSLIGRIREDLLRCSFLDDPAFVHEDHA